MVCPACRLGVVIVDESIAQAALPGTRPARSLYALQQQKTNYPENNDQASCCSAK
jgi:hypothetical protein